MPVTWYGRSQEPFLLNHTDNGLLRHIHFYISFYRPVHSQIRQFKKHSDHRYFIDPRLIGNTVCLQTGFDHCPWLRLLSAFVMKLRTRGLSAWCTFIKGRRFETLRSHSICQIISYNNYIYHQTKCPFWGAKNHFVRKSIKTYKIIILVLIKDYVRFCPFCQNPEFWF